MIPILYEHNELDFRSNGVCRLPDIVSGTVSEERNGVYECEFTYPISGKNFSEIQEGRIIACYHDDTKTIQPFDIYSRSQPIDGLVTFYAHHVSYRLGKIVIKPPLTASSCLQAFSELDGGTAFMDSDSSDLFSFWTDKSVNADFKVKVPKSVREILGGNEGSILDVYGKGEYEFDKFSVKLHLNRGSDRNVVIRYGKNLTEFKYDTDISERYDAVAPYWQGVEYDSETGTQTDIIVTLQDGYVMRDGATTQYPNEISPLDLSSYFDEPPTETQLRNKAKSILNKSNAWQIKENFDVSFARLWESEDYETYVSLQRVLLCDYVTVINPHIPDLEIKMEVIKTVYDFVEERYKSVELGSPKKNFSDSISDSISESLNEYLKNYPTKSFMDVAIDHATKLITGGLGGHVVITTNANGEPEEILIMDTTDPETARKVWRWNLNGLGYSNNGYGGPYETAITMDGQIVASFITTGVLNAGVIKAGILSDRLNNNWWNLDTGEFHLSAQNLNMSIGGTNLIRKSKDMPTDGTIHWVLDADIDAEIVPPSSSESDKPSTAVLYGSGYGLYAPTGVKIGDLLGKPVTFSFDAYAEDQSISSTPGPIDTPIDIIMSLVSNRWATYPLEFYAKITIPANTLTCGEKKRLSVTFNPTDSSYFTQNGSSYTFSNDKYVLFIIEDGASEQHENTYQFSRLKAEVGDVATDWSPAPEDTDGEIQEVHNQYSTLSNTVNGIQTEVGQIDQDIDSLSADVSSISQQADEINARVDSFSMIGGSNLIKDSYSMPTSGDTAWRILPSGSSHIDQDIDVGTGAPAAPAVATLVGSYTLAGKTLLQIGDYCSLDVQIEGQEEPDHYITLSFDAEPITSADKQNITVYLNLKTNRTDTTRNYGWKQLTIPSSNLVVGKPTRVSVTFGPIKPSYFYFYGSNEYSDNLYFSFILTGTSTSGIKVSKMKAEVGQVATDWTNQSSDDLAHSYAEFSIRANEISSKVGYDEVISSINQTAEQVKIDANKITFAGKTIDFSTTKININPDTTTGSATIGSDIDWGQDIIIIPEYGGKDMNPVFIGGQVGYMILGYSDTHSIVKIRAGDNMILLGDDTTGNGGPISIYSGNVGLRIDGSHVYLIGNSGTYDLEDVCRNSSSGGDIPIIDG